MSDYYIKSHAEAKTLHWLLRHLPGPTALDTETWGCDPRKESPVERAQLWCLTLAWYEGEGEREYMQTAFVPREFVPTLRLWLESVEHQKVGSAIIRYDRHVLANMGIRLRGIVGDTEDMSRLLNPSKMGQHGLKPQGQQLGYDVVDFGSIADRPKPGAKRTFKANRAVRRWVCDECLLDCTKAYGTEPSLGHHTCTACWGRCYQRTVHFTEGSEVQNVSFKTHETLSLPELWEHYPQRRKAIVEYAVKDARMSLDVWHARWNDLEQL